MKRIVVVAVMIVVTATFFLTEVTGGASPVKIVHGLYGSI